MQQKKTEFQLVYTLCAIVILIERGREQKRKKWKGKLNATLAVEKKTVHAYSNEL